MPRTYVRTRGGRTPAPSDPAITIKFTTPPRDSTAAREARDLSSLTRTELGHAYADAVAAVCPPGSPKARAGRALDWLRDPEVAAILAEFRRRMVAEAEDREMWIRLSDGATAWQT